MDLRRFFRAPLLLIAVAVLLLLFVLDYANSGSSYQQVDTSEIVKLIGQGQVKSALITDKNQTIQVTTKAGKNLEADWVSGQGLQLQNELQKQYDQGNLPQGYNISIPKSNALLDLIPTALIYLVIFLVFFFMLSQMQGGGNRVMNFGKSRAKLLTKDTPKTTFADVAGVDEAIEELQEIKEFLQQPAKFQAIGAKIPKGVLLYGPPGTGKTLLARAVAGGP
jgi:cell division protease FtsH